MKVLVTGAKGQLGTDLMNELAKRGIEGIGVDVQEMDITDAEACRRVIKNSGADAVIHCAAYTAVDAAEDNADLCRRINGEGTRNVAQACKEADTKLMYISTDYVFDGQGTRPWEPDDERHPLNVYGQTKYEGELAVEELSDKYFIVRIAWVFGVAGTGTPYKTKNIRKLISLKPPGTVKEPAYLSRGGVLINRLNNIIYTNFYTFLCSPNL